jgi:hypothetical protein
MNEILNIDWSKVNNHNPDWINITEWTKENLFKYYNRLNNTEGTKENNNRNKEFHYNKRKVENFTPYQKTSWEKDDDQPLLMDILEEEKKENPDSFFIKIQIYLIQIITIIIITTLLIKNKMKIMKIIIESIYFYIH